jgi:lipoyl synthase
MPIVRSTHTPFPHWLRKALPRSGRGAAVESTLRDLSLHTICEEARCPNRGECYERGTATFLILGDTCTRGCRFCAVKKGIPAPPDPAEPDRVAEAVERLALRHVVITTVTRDDLPDGGAEHFAKVVRAVRERAGACVEVLASDFDGSLAALGILLDARPDIFNHNLETVPRLYRRVRPGSDYRRSLEVLRAADLRRPRGLTKSGIMLGLGEEREEVLAVCRDLREVGVDFLTLGQYLSPGPLLPVERFVPPGEFLDHERAARAMGFRDVFAGPYVRSSYMAERALRRFEGARTEGAVPFPAVPFPAVPFPEKPGGGA